MGLIRSESVSVARTALLETDPLLPAWVRRAGPRGCVWAASCEPHVIYVWWRQRGAEGEMDPHAALLDLDERYYRAVHSSDFKIRRHIVDIQLEIEYLRIHYPGHHGKVGGSIPCTPARLLEFAIRQKLLITGDPRLE